MHIVFVHTPMPSLMMPDMNVFWRGFDIQYHAAHPGLPHMKNVLWELPHWMHWLAGVLEQHGFRSFEVLDFYTAGTSFDGIDSTKVAQTLRAHPGDIYLFSPMTPNLHLALEIADLIKVLYPESTVIFGGIVATPLHKEIAYYSAVDYVIRDRGDFALPHLLNAIKFKADLGTIGNLCYKNQHGEVITNSFCYAPISLTDLPFPKIDLFPQSTGKDIRYIRQVHSLGCPYKCSFCTIQTIGRKPTRFSIDRVLSEINAYRSYYGMHHNIYWGDETFGLNQTHTLELCHALQSAGSIHYDCQTRVNCLDNETVLRALAASGCKWVEVGIETGNAESQMMFKQGIVLDKTEERLKRVRDHGIAACSYMVNGFPNQSADDMQRSVDWVCALLGRDLLQASYWFNLVPYPGSEMFHNPGKYGMSIHHYDYKHYNEELPPVFDSVNATADEIYSVYRRGVKEIGQAMAKTPYFGAMPAADELSGYGQFWSQV